MSKFQGRWASCCRVEERPGSTEHCLWLEADICGKDLGRSWVATAVNWLLSQLVVARQCCLFAGKQMLVWGFAGKQVLFWAVAGGQKLFLAFAIPAAAVAFFGCCQGSCCWICCRDPSPSLSYKVLVVGFVLQEGVLQALVRSLIQGLHPSGGIVMSNLLVAAPCFFGFLCVLNNNGCTGCTGCNFSGCKGTLDESRDSLEVRLCHPCSRQ